MPSFLFAGLSGGDPLFSGNPFSGIIGPMGGIQIRNDRSSSGNLYVGLSGGVTVQSGGTFASGLSGMLDGMQLGPGDSYFIPKLACRSGTPSIHIGGDPACPLFARVYYEFFTLFLAIGMTLVSNL